MDTETKYLLFTIAPLLWGLVVLTTLLSYDIYSNIKQNELYIEKGYKKHKICVEYRTEWILPVGED